MRILNLLTIGIIALILMLAAAAVAGTGGILMPQTQPWWFDTIGKVCVFLLEVIKVIAWPLVAICILRIIRPYLGRIFDNFKKGKFEFPGGSVEIEAELDKARDTEEKLRQEAGTPAVTRDSIDNNTSPREAEKFDLLAQNSPQAAIITSYISVEQSLREAWMTLIKPTQSPAPNYKNYSNVSSITRDLRKIDFIDADLSRLLDSLRRVRNSVIHEIRLPVSAEDAQEYNDLAQSAELRIRQKLLLRAPHAFPSSSTPR